MTTYTEMTEKAADQLLSAVKPLSDLTRTFADAATTGVSKLPTGPRPQGLPTALEVVTAHFAFAERLLAAQRDFAFDLAGAGRQPEATAATAASAAKKSTAKRTPPAAKA